jgi:hypothetical protein
MARLPRFEFASQILATRFTQLSYELWILRRQPVFQFIQRLD